MMFDKIIFTIVSIVLVVMLLAVAWAVLSPRPTCPDGYVLAGGGYGGRYHCVPGVEPTR